METCPGTGSSLVGALSKDDLALRLDDIVTPARRRYDATAFQERQKEWASRGGPVLSANSYFDAVRQGIQAAQLAAQNLEIFITSMMALDHRHIDQVMRFVEIQATNSKVSIAEDGFTEFLNSIRKTRWVVNACYVAMILATSQSVKKPGRGKPLSIYIPLAIELGEFWEELTGKPVVTPKDAKNGKPAKDAKTGKPVVTTKSAKTGEPESSQTSTQFIWLAMQMAVPNIKLQQAETAIRNAIPMLRFRNPATDPRKKTSFGKNYVRIQA